MAPEKARWHKSLVLALLSALTKFIHASISTPVRMPLISFPETGSKHQAQDYSAQDALLSHTLKGIQQ